MDEFPSNSSDDWETTKKFLLGTFINTIVLALWVFTSSATVESFDLVPPHVERINFKIGLLAWCALTVAGVIIFNRRVFPFMMSLTKRTPLGLFLYSMLWVVVIEVILMLTTISTNFEFLAPNGEPKFWVVMVYLLVFLGCVFYLPEIINWIASKIPIMQPREDENNGE